MRHTVGYYMRRAFFIISIFIFLMSTSQANKSYLESINQLKWDSRIILVRPIDNLEEILLDLKMADQEIVDRHINWFVISQSGIYTNYERNIADSFKKEIFDKYFSIDGFNVVLIGKDGGVKERAKNLNLNSIFDLIDSMPMRQNEMKNK